MNDIKTESKLALTSEQYDHLIALLPVVCIEETLAINPYTVEWLCANEYELSLLKQLLNYALNKFAQKIKEGPLGI